MGRALTWKRCGSPQGFSFTSLIFYAWNRAISIFECLVLWKGPKQCGHLLRIERYQVTLLEVTGFLQTSWETSCIYPRCWGCGWGEYNWFPTQAGWYTSSGAPWAAHVLALVLHSHRHSRSMKVSWTQRPCSSSCHSWWPHRAGILATGYQTALKIQAAGCLIKYQQYSLKQWQLAIWWN